MSTRATVPPDRQPELVVVRPAPGLAGTVAAMRVLAMALAFVLLAGGCATRPTPAAGTPSQALDAGADSPLGRVGAALLSPAARDGESALVPLVAGADAWAARLMLVEHAERSVDLQYYIFRPDASGRALPAALRRAADRGVRVRLLLDDWGAKPDADTSAGGDRRPAGGRGSAGRRASAVTRPSAPGSRG